MPVIKKAKSNISYGGGANLSSDVKSYENDPVIVKKNESARIAVSKLILPGTRKK